MEQDHKMVLCKKFTKTGETYVNTNASAHIDDNNNTVEAEFSSQASSRSTSANTNTNTNATTTTTTSTTIPTRPHLTNASPALVHSSSPQNNHHHQQQQNRHKIYATNNNNNNNSAAHQHQQMQHQQLQKKAQHIMGLLSSGGSSGSVSPVMGGPKKLKTKHTIEPQQQLQQQQQQHAHQHAQFPLVSPNKFTSTASSNNSSLNKLKAIKTTTNGITLINHLSPTSTNNNNPSRNLQQTKNPQIPANMNNQAVRIKLEQQQQQLGNLIAAVAAAGGKHTVKVEFYLTFIKCTTFCLSITELYI
jgi:hypothetical protein